MNGFAVICELIGICIGEIMICAFFMIRDRKLNREFKERFGK